VFSYATKVLLALTLSAALASGVYYAVEGGKFGAILMLVLSGAALLALVAVVAAGVRDIAPFVPADAPAPERRATTPGAAAQGSGWPLVAAAALTILAVGAATDAPTAYMGLIAVGLASLGWFAKAWTDHPTWTPRINQRVTGRLVDPLGFPVAGFVTAAFVAITLSRVLLAVSLDVAPWIALAVALLILLGCFWIASRPGVRSSALIGLAAVGGLFLVGAGIAGATQGERTFHPHEHVEAIEVRAKNTQFAEKRLEAPANADVTIKFENDDPGIYHNVAVYESEDAEAAPLFNGQGIPGVKTAKYTFKTPGPGEYVFRCDFHANMVGTFVVEGG
jgi:plastocyanin